MPGEQQSGACYRFGAVEVDAAAYVLRRDGRRIGVQPKVFELLVSLIERRGQLVTHAELLAELWPGRRAHRSMLTWAMCHVREAIGQRQGEAEPIETVTRR